MITSLELRSGVGTFRGALKMKRIHVLLVVAMLGGCASGGLYEWGSYSQDLLVYAKNPQGAKEFAERLAANLRAVIGARGLPWSVTQLGARIEFQFCAVPPRTGREAGMATVRLNAGSRHGVTAADIVGKIAGVTRLPASIVGAIDLLEDHALVDVEAHHAELIVKKLARVRVKGVSLEPRPETPSA